ncbi:MAG: carbonic anhydrase [Betaproteobacteria bacterium]|nr:carbonic anhydrase [Betaproteobacteria bacterium]
MTDVAELLERNRAWAGRTLAANPSVFASLGQQQAPEFLWIGCSDSRVPANQITGLAPGEVFVRRNIANVVVHTDLNCLAVLNFAIDLLKVRHVIVCGHYGCSGVHAAMTQRSVGLADNWLRHVQDVREKRAAELEAIADEAGRARRLCELNVHEQVRNVCISTVLRDAQARAQRVSVHGWVYGIEDGRLRDLHCTQSGPA